MTRRRGNPERGEFVICTITKLNPHSAYANIEEYNKEGMIHISEIASGWVKDIRKFIKKGQTVVAKVIRIDDRGILLSMKRVNKKQKNERLKEFRLGQRAEKMLELAAKTLGRNLDDAYNEVGYLLQDSLGSIYEGFKLAVINPEKLEKIGVPKEWIDAIKPIAEKNIEQKNFEFRAMLKIRTLEPDGLSTIKKIVSKAEKAGLSVHYIAAPDYLVKYVTKNAKKGGKKFTEILDSLSKEKAVVSWEKV